MFSGEEIERLETRSIPEEGSAASTACFWRWREIGRYFDVSQASGPFFLLHIISLSPTPPADMPIPIITQGIVEGLSSIPYSYTILKVLPFILIIAALKYYFGGARNDSERLMHSKVVMVTV